jgi:hypothetical protein
MMALLKVNVFLRLYGIEIALPQLEMGLFPNRDRAYLA